MQLYAFLDFEFWLILLRGLWPVLAIPCLIGFGAGWAARAGVQKFKRSKVQGRGAEI